MKKKNKDLYELVQAIVVILAVTAISYVYTYVQHVDKRGGARMAFIEDSLTAYQWVISTPEGFKKVTFSRGGKHEA